MQKYALPLLLVCAIAFPAFADDKPKPDAKPDDKPAAEAKPAVAELGKKAPAITMRDVEGRAFDLHDCEITRKDAEAVVLAAARKFGAAKDANLKTKIADLKGVKDEDGDLDATLVKDLAAACGHHAGLVATEESAEAFKTLGDVTDWVVASNDAPILLVTWSPRCPAVRRTNDRVVEIAAKNKLRLFAVASNTRDQDEHYAQFKENFDWNVRIFPDREQHVTDILGGKTTPHFFLFDTKGALQYKGGLDNDAMGYMEEADRKNYLVDAAVAIRAGKEVEVKESTPSG